MTIPDHVISLVEKCEAAETRAAELQTQRDAAYEKAFRWVRNANKSEARVRQLEEALREIGYWDLTQEEGKP